MLKQFPTADQLVGRIRTSCLDMNGPVLASLLRDEQFPADLAANGFRLANFGAGVFANGFNHDGLFVTDSQLAPAGSPVTARFVEWSDRIAPIWMLTPMYQPDEMDEIVFAMMENGIPGSAIAEAIKAPGNAQKFMDVMFYSEYAVGFVTDVDGNLFVYVSDNRLTPADMEVTLTCVAWPMKKFERVIVLE